jgi:hypothetical protein
MRDNCRKRKPMRKMPKEETLVIRPIVPHYKLSDLVRRITK